MAKFGKSSRERLATCDDRLQDVFNEVIKYVDCSVLEGHRGEERQNRFVDEGKRALKVAKESGEEIVTLYRGVGKWHPGEMVKGGKFKGGGAHVTGYMSGRTRFTKDYLRTSHSKAIGEDIADDAIWLTDLKDVAKNYSKMPPKGFEELYKRKGIKSGFLLEFEVPKSWIKKKGIPLYQSIESYEGAKKTVKEGLQYVFQEGIPKEFLKKVHK